MIKRNAKSAVILLMIVHACVTAALAAYVLLPEREDAGRLGFHTAEGGKYTLYIGTNDKDTYRPVMALEQARELVNAICAGYTDGYTVSQAEGGWVDEHRVLTRENTLVYTFYEASEGQIISIMDEVLEKLNQNSVLLERQDVTYCFYSGKD